MSSTKSYTARLQERTGARERAAQRAAQRPAWMTTESLPALLAVAAEVNHLVAAIVEWPVSPWRGVVHVLIAAALGVFAATAHFRPGRVLFTVGSMLGLVAPLAWLGSVFVTEASPYLDYPVAAAICGTVIELGLVGLLVRAPH
jgi:hypothetical protein